MHLCASLLLISGLWISVSGIKYHHFDDYLSSLDVEEQSTASDNGLAELEDGSGEIPTPFPDPLSGNEEIATPFPDPLSGSQVEDEYIPLMRSRYLWSKDVTCCLLGQMAADKGYHCNANFYAVRILLRNKNRAHNKKMGFYGRDKVPNYGNKLMRTFEQCVARRGKIFHKCCHETATLRRSKIHYDSLQKKRYEQRRYGTASKNSPTVV